MPDQPGESDQEQRHDQGGSSIRVRQRRRAAPQIDHKSTPRLVPMNDSVDSTERHEAPDADEAIDQSVASSSGRPADDEGSSDGEDGHDRRYRSSDIVGDDGGDESRSERWAEPSQCDKKLGAVPLEERDRSDDGGEQDDRPEHHDLMSVERTLGERCIQNSAEKHDSGCPLPQLGRRAKRRCFVDS